MLWPGLGSLADEHKLPDKEDETMSAGDGDQTWGSQGRPGSPAVDLASISTGLGTCP